MSTQDSILNNSKNLTSHSSKDTSTGQVRIVGRGRGEGGLSPLSPVQGYRMGNSGNNPSGGDKHGKERSNAIRVRDVLANDTDDDLQGGDHGKRNRGKSAQTKERGKEGSLPGVESVEKLLRGLDRDRLVRIVLDLYSLLTHGPTPTPPSPPQDPILTSLLSIHHQTIPYPLFTYTGDTVNSLPSGQGKAIYSHGGSYTGQWVQGVKEGLGTHTDGEGNRYHGYYASDLFHGLGRYTHNHGSSYYGSFVYDKKEGPYVYRFSDGRILHGEYVNDIEEGEYVLISSDKKIVKFGQKHNGMKTGETVVYTLSGMESWKEGCLEKTSKVINL